MYYPRWWSQNIGCNSALLLVSCPPLRRQRYMGQMYLFEELAYFRGKLLQNILSGDAAEGDGGSLSGMGQVVEAGGKVCVANKTAGCGASEV